MAAINSEWVRCLESLKRFSKKKTYWQKDEIVQLKATLCELTSLAQTHQPCVSPTSNHQQSSGAALLHLLAKLSCFALEDQIGDDDKGITAAVLLCTAEFVWAAQTSTPDDAHSSMPIAEALVLAQQLGNSGILPVLSSALLEQYASNTNDATLVAIQYDLNSKMPGFHNGSAVLLHLANAIARMWPGGILKSAAAGSLAPAATQLAGEIMRDMKYASKDFRRESVVAGIAVFALQLVQQLQRIVSSPRAVAATMPHIEELKASEGFLLLVMLVMHAQVHQFMQHMEAVAGTAAAAGAQQQHTVPASNQQQQQAVDCWHQAVVPASNQQQQAVVPASNQQQQQPVVPASNQQQQVDTASNQQQQDVAASNQQQCWVLHPADIAREVQHCIRKANSLIGDSVSKLWNDQRCWLKYSSASNLCTTLQLLEQLLLFWVSRVADFCSGEYDDLLSEDMDEILSATVPMLPVLLLHITRSSLHQQQRDLALCTAAVNAATAAVDVLNGESIDQAWDVDESSFKILLMQSAELLHEVLDLPNCDADLAATAAAAASSPADLASKLLLLLAQLIWLGYSCKLPLRSHARYVLRAMEHRIRSAPPQAGVLFCRGTASRAIISQCIEDAISLDRGAGPLFELAIAGLSIDPAGAAATASAAKLRAALCAFFASTLKAYPVDMQLPSNGHCADMQHYYKELTADVVTDVQAAVKLMCGLLQRSSSSNSGASAQQQQQLDHASWLLLLCRALRVRVLQVQHTIQTSLCRPHARSKSSSSDTTYCSNAGGSSSSGRVDDVYNATGRIMAAMQAVVESCALVTDNCKDVVAVGCCAELCNINGNKQQQQQQAGRNADSATSWNAWFPVVMQQQLVVEYQKFVEGAYVTARNIQTGQHIPLIPRKLNATTQCSSTGSHQDSHDSSTAAFKQYGRQLATAKTYGDVLLALQQFKPLFQLHHSMLAAVDGLCALLPVSWCCNNPGCSNLSGHSELQLVGGKSCICAGCNTARYCSRNCQRQHWKLHQPVCERIREQQQQQLLGILQTEQPCR